MVTQEELKKLLHYEPTTGVFTWRVRRQRIAAGTIAGTIMNRGYCRIHVNNKLYLSHRLAWLYVYGKLPKELDHINREKTDNRIENLREISHQKNTKNQSLRSDNKSGFTGINWHKCVNKWQVRLRTNGTNIQGGCFSSLKEAVLVRNRLEKQHGFNGFIGELG